MGRDIALEKYNKGDPFDNGHLVFICVAGRSKHLPG